MGFFPKVLEDGNYNTQIFYLDFNYFQPLEIFVGEEKGDEEKVESFQKSFFSMVDFMAKSLKL